MTRNEAIDIIKAKYPDLNTRHSRTDWLVQLAKDIQSNRWQ